jgi:hypothetical protein
MLDADVGDYRLSRVPARKIGQIHHDILVVTGRLHPLDHLGDLGLFVQKVGLHLYRHVPVRLSGRRAFQRQMEGFSQVVGQSRRGTRIGDQQK